LAVIAKYLVVVLVVVLLGWLLLRKPRRKAHRDAAIGKPQAMVACAHCGLHLPGGDAVRSNGRTFCSEAHRLAGPRGQ
jgi:uncharacterized protein